MFAAFAFSSATDRRECTGVVTMIRKVAYTKAFRLSLKEYRWWEIDSGRINKSQHN
jgi:hypothetical protein